jgi:hypothetical protein
MVVPRNVEGRLGTVIVCRNSRHHLASKKG